MWSRVSIPRHAFITWVAIQHRLPTKKRLSRFMQQLDLQCPLCQAAEEDDHHLFQVCPYAKDVWDALAEWWPTSQALVSLASSSTCAGKVTAHLQIAYAIYAAAIYHIWYARNQCLFKNQCIPIDHTIRQIKNQIQHRVLFLNTVSRTYRKSY